VLPCVLEDQKVLLAFQICVNHSRVLGQTLNLTLGLADEEESTYLRMHLELALPSLGIDPVRRWQATVLRNNIICRILQYHCQRYYINRHKQGKFWHSSLSK
jgi:hypothetical protein